MARGPFKRPICPNRGLPHKHIESFGFNTDPKERWVLMRRKNRVRCKVCGRVFEAIPRYHTLPPER